MNNIHILKVKSPPRNQTNQIKQPFSREWLVLKVFVMWLQTTKAKSTQTLIANPLISKSQSWQLSLTTDINPLLGCCIFPDGSLPIVWVWPSTLPWILLDLSFDGATPGPHFDVQTVENFFGSTCASGHFYLFAIFFEKPTKSFSFTHSPAQGSPELIDFSAEWLCPMWIQNLLPIS